MNADALPIDRLLSLSHELGREDRRLAILGEGNTSMRTGPDSFLVKSSGSNLATLTRTAITECRAGPLLALLDETHPTDAAVDASLVSAQCDSSARKPSVEAMFHAWLLTLPGVEFVGHTHPVAVNALLCSSRAAEFAQRRIFPDEIVCCGPESVLVPYTDPGVVLAREIRQQVTSVLERTGLVPRVILLENHGLIALGGTPQAVLAATLMAAKAAEITLGASAVGGPRYLSAENVARIAGRSDEHHRQKMLGL